MVALQDEASDGTSDSTPSWNALEGQPPGFIVRLKNRRPGSFPHTVWLPVWAYKRLAHHYVPLTG